MHIHARHVDGTNLRGKSLHNLRMATSLSKKIHEVIIQNLQNSICPGKICNILGIQQVLTAENRKEQYEFDNRKWWFLGCSDVSPMHSYTEDKINLCTKDNKAKKGVCKTTSSALDQAGQRA